MDYDLIIVGSGAVGSSAGYFAGKAGTKVLMIDSNTPPHKNGSHHGGTRIFRCAYGDGTQYMPMLLRAKNLWYELNPLYENKIFNKTGVLNMGPIDSDFMITAQSCVQDYNLDAVILTPEEVRKRWPEFTVPDNYVVVYEKDTGILKPEVAVEALVKLSKEAGAEQLFDTKVTALEPIKDGVEVTTSAGKFTARKALVTAGTWVRNLLPELPITPTRKVIIWHKADEGYEKIPIFVINYGKTSYFYGFPTDSIGFKVAKHDGGQPIKSLEEYVPFGEVEEDRLELVDFLHNFIPGVGEVVHGEACTYDMSPDGDFIIDKLPSSDNVLVMTGLSGHGFKFVSVLGEIGAMFGRDEECPFDLSPFKLNRFK